MDLATGPGDAALHLAARGWSTSAVDVSEVAIDHLRRRTKLLGFEVDAVVADLSEWNLGVSSWDLICCFRFLDRGVLNRVGNALKPGGHLVLETFSSDHPRISPGNKPRRSEYLLDPREVPALLGGLRLRYLEDRSEATERGGRRAVIRLVAEKTKRDKGSIEA